MQTQVINATEYRNVSLALLSESKTNPRRVFEDAALKELASTIRTQGVLSPLLVRPVTENGFEIVFGARRYRAAQLSALQRRGTTTCACSYSQTPPRTSRFVASPLSSIHADVFELAIANYSLAISEERRLLPLLKLKVERLTKKAITASSLDQTDVLFADINDTSLAKQPLAIMVVDRARRTLMLRKRIVGDIPPLGLPVLDCFQVLKSAEREIASFHRAVSELYGSEMAQKAVLDWLEVMEGMTIPPDDTIAYWRRVTIFAADRLAIRICQPTYG